MSIINSAIAFSLLALQNPTISSATTPQEVAIANQEASLIKKESFKSSFRKFTQEASLQKSFTNTTFDPIYVGQLQEKWQFPSDHLPIGLTIEDFNIVSWNVLNTAYMSWVYKNTQGLSSSLIAKEDIICKENGLTIRDQHVVDLVLEMISHPTHPRSVLCLQECGPAFLQELQERLPNHMKIIFSSDINSTNQDIVIYDSLQFNYLEEESSIDFNAFPCEEGRPIMNIALEKNGIKYRFFNAHVPGNPQLPGRYEFADYIFKHKNEDEVTIGLGDLNFNADEMDLAFMQASLNNDVENHFKRLSPYNTNVGLDFFSKAIDHFIIDKGLYPINMIENQPNELLKELGKTVDLLNHS